METAIQAIEKMTTPTPLLTTLRRACKKIAPLWSLDNFVAVNPYLGLIQHDFKDVAQQLEVVADIQMTLPISFYLKKIEEGNITKKDIEWVLRTKPTETVDSFIEKLKSLNIQATDKSSIPTIADLASTLTDKDWSRFFVGRISFWAASYFDDGQAIWKSNQTKANLFTAWKSEAQFDRTPELTGLNGFRKKVQTFPDNALDAAQVALEQLNVPNEMLPYYLHSLLLNVGGWSAYAARVEWDNELFGGKDGELIYFLAV